MSETVWIRNADICDGTARKIYRGEILIRNGFIAEICPKTNRPESAVTFDADGLLACPGFIDTHAHSDISLLAAPEAYGKISQGITTEISGNCGLSSFPVCTQEVREHLSSIYANYKVPIDWTDFQGFSKALESRHPILNAGFLCGHNTLRANILGYEDAPNGPNEWKKMQMLLAETLEQGAFGMSTGLLYIPGKFSSPEELFTLAEALKNYDAPYVTHLRSEGNALLEAIEEALSIAKMGSGHLHISHLKTALPENWHKLDAVFSRLDAARSEGMRVTCDRYPYTFGQTSLSVILPPPYDKMTDNAIEELLRKEPFRIPELTSALTALNLPWNGILLCSSKMNMPEDLFGLPIPEIADRLGMTPPALCAALVAADGGTQAAFGGLSEENMKRIIDSPYVCCGTDETARPLDYSIGRSHPRGFGSFARFVEFEKEKRSCEEIIGKLTSFAASVFGISDRGELIPGKAADIQLLDWANYKSCSTFGTPHVPCSGVKRVYVNGILSYEDGQIRDFAGKILKKRKKIIK